MVAAIRKLSDKPIQYIINTHMHPDHTGGNSSLGSEGVTIIAQEEVKARMSSVQNVPFVGLRDGHYPSQALPTVTYLNNLTLRQGQERLD